MLTNGWMEYQKEVGKLKNKRRNFAEGFAKKAAKAGAAAAFGIAALVASPEHIFNNQAPIPLAFTMR